MEIERNNDIFENRKKNENIEKEIKINVEKCYTKH